MFLVQGTNVTTDGGIGGHTTRASPVTVNIIDIIFSNKLLNGHMMDFLFIVQFLYYWQMGHHDTV